ncbi:MAG: cupin domain-containing protein, partial [Myxococcota bacterium]
FKRFCAEHLSRIPDYRPNPFPPDKAPADRLRYSMRVAAKVVGFSVANRWYGDTSADRQSQRTVEVPRLQTLLAPIDASRFYEEDWGRRVVQVSGAEDRFRDLLTDEEVELIRRGRIGRGSAERIGEKNEPYRAEGVKHTSEDVTSFRIRRAQSLLGPLRKLATNWCEELGEEININVYVSPSKNTPGLAPHSDAYDIFVLQVSGLKHWTFSGIAGVDGLREPLGPREDRPGTYGTDGSLTMRPGDLLYIPMGMRHVAIADGHIPSVHLTIGIHRKTGYSVAQWLMQRLTEKLPIEHLALTNGPMGSQQNHEDAVARVSDVLRALLDDPEATKDFHAYRKTLEQRRTEVTASEYWVRVRGPGEFVLA